jgi:hypothetical protein
MVLSCDQHPDLRFLKLNFRSFLYSVVWPVVPLLYIELGSLESTSGIEPVGCLRDGFGEASDLEIVVRIRAGLMELDEDRSISATTSFGCLFLSCKLAIRLNDHLSLCFRISLRSRPESISDYSFEPYLISIYNFSPDVKFFLLGSNTDRCLLSVLIATWFLCHLNMTF